MKRGSLTVIILAVMLSLNGCSSKSNVSTQNTVPTQTENQEIVENIAETISGSDDTTKAGTDILSGKSVEEILAHLTLGQKAAQMVQGAVYNVTNEEMQENCYGSILSTYGGARVLNAAQWKEMILKLQENTLCSDAGIPFVYGNDAVHGVNTCAETVIFPHNIGIGAANDKELTYQMGLAVANEAKLTGMLWSFSPCIAVAKDPRWGRTYESYSSEVDIVTNMGTAFAKGMLDGGVMPCAKHFFADGSEGYGTGEDSEGVDRLIDRGNASLSDGEIQKLLGSYQALIDAGVKTIMINHGSLNGVKMHENEKYISMLKNDMGFDGFIVSDWNSIHNITGDSLKDQTITAINAGIDMLMEADDFEECRKYIIDAVSNGKISEERINDAVARILIVKKEMGILDDPMMEKVTSEVDSTGSVDYRNLAKKMVEESMVLLKNDNDILPFKKGMKIFVTGPAADDVGVQCGGWTLTWRGSSDFDNNEKKWIADGKSILYGLYKLAKENDLTIITNKRDAADADITLLCLGEKTYAEWEGDSEDISITGKLALNGNEKAIAFAESLGHPTIACIVSGRNVIINDYMNQWDGVVLCYLPGSEGDGVANVLTGKSSFKGTLPMPYYADVKDVGTEKILFPVGYGLTYK